MPKVFMKTLGCDKNTVDSEFILGKLVSNGLEITEDIAKADIVIVNTCCFIEDATKESIEAIFDCLNEKKEEAKILVTGCMTQRYKEELKEEIPEIDNFFKLDEQDKILDYLGLGKVVEDIRITPDKAFSYLKISDGCDRNCSYCTIPGIRGRHKSLKLEEIFRQAKELEDNGVKELILVAQDLTQYGNDLNEEVNFETLLHELSKRFDFDWIRLLYLYPEGITDSLIQTIKQSKNILPYFDIPIQHTNDRILKLMNRSIRKEGIRRVVEKIREEMPDSIIRSTVIVGFPTETEEEFEELKEDLKELSLDRLGAFSYSREEGTKAFDLNPQIEEETKETRKEEITELSLSIMNERNKNFTNNILDCLIEEEIDKNTYTGRLYSDAPEIDCITYVNSSRKLEPGEIVPVKIRDTLDYDFIGDLYEPAK